MFRVVSKNLLSVVHALPSFLYMFLTMLSLVTLMAAKHDYDARRYLEDNNFEVDVVPPSTRPPLSQESIAIALSMFNIDVPTNVLFPTLDIELEDRGLTTLRGWGRKLEVTVGPAAFESWALLGSTLSHELEIHCRQNFTLIRAMDLLGMSGTWQAEREAYLHEIQNSRRFHLNENELTNIQATMDFYYPEKVSVR